MSVSECTVRDLLSRIDKDAKVRNRRIFALWMACHTQEEIAEREGITKETVSEICREMADLPKSDKAAAEHATEFTVPIYNVWKQQEIGGSHPGVTPPAAIAVLISSIVGIFDSSQLRPQ